MAPRGAAVKPSLREERSWLRRGHRVVVGMDEVGRGALAGPVTVGVVAVDARTPSAPVGVRDSKLLTPHAREALVPLLRRWGVCWGVGHASAQEIDAVGIMGALRLAGRRALEAAAGEPDLVLLDGSHDWLTDPAEVGLFDTGAIPPVQTLVKGDMRCSSIAAASVLAKVARDRIMVELGEDDPRWGWESNKGYAAQGHLAQLQRSGPSRFHRCSWGNVAAAASGRATAENVGEKSGAGS